MSARIPGVTPRWLRFSAHSAGAVGKTIGEERHVLDDERDKKMCEVFGCGRVSSGSYAIAPGTRIRLCRQCAEREEVIFDARPKPIKEGGNGDHPG